jgi:redox-sensitive bicupin YhaK (pirin superfamily)
MLMLRRAQERHHHRLVHPQASADPLAGGFGDLEFFNEHHVPPGWGIPHSAFHDAEVITYVSEGAITFDDSTGSSGTISAGEVHRRSAVRGVRHSELNASRTEWARVFEIGLRASGVDREPEHDKMRIYEANRRGVLLVVASRSARPPALRLHRDALVYSSMLASGAHLVHPIAPGRVVWLHVVRGQLTVGDVTLRTGDGAGVEQERALSFTARASTEVLLVDMPGGVARRDGLRAGSDGAGLAA